MFGVVAVRDLEKLGRAELHVADVLLFAARVFDRAAARSQGFEVA